MIDDLQESVATDAPVSKLRKAKHHNSVGSCLQQTHLREHCYGRKRAMHCLVSVGAMSRRNTSLRCFLYRRHELLGANRYEARRAVFEIPESFKFGV